MIAAADLLALCPKLGLRVNDWIDPLNAAMDAAEINTPARIAAFLANAAHESAQFTQLVENLNYSAEALLRTWPRRFTPDLARAYERQPEKIANFVYGGRMGNIEDGDGWRYRGRGVFQITGRDNYHACSLAICNSGKALLDAPDLLEQIDYAAMSAGWYWTALRLNDRADTGRLDPVADLINLGRQTEAVGDSIGYADRLAYFNKASELLA